MVPVEVRQQPHVSFTQIDQYLRCPLKYRFTYLDRLEPDFVPAALAFGCGIHGAAAFFFRGAGQGGRPSVADVQGYFETLWKLESEHRPLRFGEKDTKESLLDLATRMLAVLASGSTPARRWSLSSSPSPCHSSTRRPARCSSATSSGRLTCWSRDSEGRLVVVDLKTSARRYTDLQVEASLQLSVYSYATGLLGYADSDDLRLRFDVLTKTKQPELHWYWTTRDRAANARLFRIASEVLAAIEVGVFLPNPGWQCKECQFKSKCWAWG